MLNKFQLAAEFFAYWTFLHIHRQNLSICKNCCVDRTNLISFCTYVCGHSTLLTALVKIYQKCTESLQNCQKILDRHTTGNKGEKIQHIYIQMSQWYKNRETFFFERIKVKHVAHKKTLFNTIDNCRLNPTTE